MDVTPLIRKGQQIIQAYAGGSFKISGQIYDGAVIVRPDGTSLWDVEIADISNLKLDDFSTMIADKGNIDVVLFGCGKNMAILPRELRAALKDCGLSVDSMDTGAACRTYNVLMAEGRRVVCALLPYR